MSQELLNAIIDNQINKVKEILSKGFNLNEKKEEFGLQHKYEDDYFYNAGTIWNCYYFQGEKKGDSVPWTPLQFAACLGRDSIVRILLENGADKNIKDDLNQTAEIIAEHRLKSGSVNILKNVK